MPHRKFTDIFRHKEDGVRYVLPADECVHDTKGKIKTCQEHDISEQMSIYPYQTVGKDNHYILIAIFGRGHQTIKAKAGVVA
jgi:hypothetical protein